MLPIILAIKDETERNYVAEIYEKYKAALFLVANDVLHHEADSWNCVHDAIVELIDHFETFVTLNEMQKNKYLYLCCKCAAINYYKGKKEQRKHEFSNHDSEAERDFEIPDSSADVEREYISREAIQRVLRIVEAMGEEYVDTLYFKFIYNYTDSQAARLLGISVNNYRVRLTRIRKRLKLYFGREASK